jgi:hypothetical protein
MSWRRVATILWFPVFFAIVLPVTFQVVYHQPKPHHIQIGVVGSAGQVELVASELNHVSAGGFAVRAYRSTPVAMAAVAHRKVAAAYVGGPSSTLYVARVASALRASYLQGVFTTLAIDASKPPPRLVDVVPSLSGNGTTAIFFFAFPLMMIGLITSIVLLQLPGWGIGRRVSVVVGVGAIGALTAYLTAVWFDVLPGKPLLLVYAFVLTQVYGLLMVGLTPWVKQFFLPVSLTWALILSVPSSGGTVSPDMMPALFHDLSYVLPLAQTVTVTRGVSYFHNAGIAQATWVLGLWAAVAVAVVAFSWLAQARGRPGGVQAELRQAESPHRAPALTARWRH